MSTSDLRPEALDTFIGDSVSMTRVLAEDPFGALPDPVLYEGRASVDLQLDDPAYPTVTPEQRRKAAQQMEEAARAVKGAEAILSVSTGFEDTRTESFRVASNGFEGTRVDTVFFVSAQVSVKDADGRRPEDSSFGGSRFLGEVPATAVVGREAAERAISRLGAKKPPSAVMTLVIDNRAAGRLMGALVGKLTIGSGKLLTLESGAVYDFEVDGTTASPTADLLDLTGPSSTVSLDPSGSYTLNVSNLGSVDPTGKTFVLIDYTGTDPSGIGTWTINYGAGASTWSGGSVSVDSTNKSIVLTGVIIPEPATIAGVLCLGLPAILRRRRR